MAKKQEILDARDNLRVQVEDLDGGYATVAKLLRKSSVFVLNTLSEKNVPRLATLEDIKDAVETAKRKQKARIDRLTA